MRKLERFGILAFAAALAIFSPAGTSYADETVPDEGPGASEDTSEDDLTVTYGFGNTAHRGRYLAVNVSTGLNPGEIGDGSGEAKVLFLVRESGGEVCRYEYPLTIGEDGGSLTAYIPLGVRSSEMRVILQDENGNTAVERRISMPAEGEKPVSYIGILSDRSGQLSWMDSVEMNDNTFTTRTILLDDDIPDNALAYDQLDMIVISDYDTGNLTDEETAALREYAENGGILLFGGGADYQTTFGPFLSELVEEPYRSAQTMMVNLGLEYAEESPEDSMVELEVADISLKDGGTLIPGEHFPLAAASSWKKGRAVVTAFSLCDISDFCRQHPDFARHLLSSVYGEAGLEAITTGGGGISGSYSSIEDLVGAGDLGRLPNRTLYLVVLIAYLALVGPVAYFFLRRRGKSRYYLAIVTGTAALFAVLIYVLGVRTRFRSTFYTSATYLDLTDDTPEEEVYLNLRSPYTRPYSTKLADGYEICPVTDPDASTDTASIGDPEDYNIAISCGDGDSEIRIRGTSAFEPNYFRLKRQAESTGTIDSDIHMFGGALTGSVTSHYPETLENAVLLMYGRIVLIGDIAPEETKDLSACQVIECPPGHASAAAEAASGLYELPEGGEKTQAMERMRMFRFYLEQEVIHADEGARFAAFLPGDDNTAFLAEENRLQNSDGSPVAANGMTMVTARMDVNREQDGAVCRCALTVEPRVLEGKYDFSDNTMTAEPGMESLTVEYMLGSHLTIQRVDFEMPDEIFSDGSIDTGEEPFAGNLYFYNYDTGSEDLMRRKESYSSEELAPYLSPSNTLTVRYSAGAITDSRRYNLPVLYSVGTEETP